MSSDEHFERIAFDLVRDRTENRQADFPIIGGEGQHDRRSATSVFVARLRIKGNPDGVTAIRDVGHASPHFVPNRRASVKFIMPICVRNPGQ